MAEYVIDNHSEDAYARVFFYGDVTPDDVARAYRDLMSREDLSLLHRFLWDFRRARLDALSDQDLTDLACGANGGRHPHNDQVISDAVVVDRAEDYERIVRWRDIAWTVAGVADCVFTDFHEAVRWLLSNPGVEDATPRARA